MTNAADALYIHNDEARPSLKLLRLVWKGHSASGYLEQEVCENLGLDSQRDRSLLMLYDEELQCYILFKDTKLTDHLRPLIISAKQRVFELRAMQNEGQNE